MEAIKINPSKNPSSCFYCHQMWKAVHTLNQPQKFPDCFVCSYAQNAGPSEPCRLSFRCIFNWPAVSGLSLGFNLRKLLLVDQGLVICEKIIPLLVGKLCNVVVIKLGLNIWLVIKSIITHSVQ